MPLKAKKPQAVEKRLKLMLFGPSGCGKTLAAAQFPKAYFIDTERGCENQQYVNALEAAGSMIFQSTDYAEVMDELRALLVEKHDFRTVVIDPVTTIFHEQLEVAERTLSDTTFGRPYGEAGKMFRRMFKRLMNLDMNVIITCHAKILYGDEMEKLGFTYDSWNKTDYVFDLVLQLINAPPLRKAKVEKTRIEAFKPGELFTWSYEEFVNRYGSKVEEAATPKKTAAPAKVKKVKRLLEMVTLPPGTEARWLTKAGVGDYDDMTEEQIDGCIKYIEGKINGEK